MKADQNNIEMDKLDQSIHPWFLIILTFMQVAFGRAGHANQVAADTRLLQIGKP